jgi:hypothetical protein
LNLKGRDRLAALTWIEARWSNFGLGRLQYLNISALESVLSGAGDNRAEVSELLIGMAGHFSALESGPMFSLRPLLQAFRLKAELAGQQRSPTMHSYAAVAQALAGVMVGGDTVIQDTAGVDRSKLRNAQHAARYLPGRISHAIWITGDTDGYRSSQRFAQVPGRYVSRTINAAHSLVDLALADPEGIVMPYLRGRVAESTNPRGPWVTTLTAVEEFVIKKPDVFRAALEFEEARSELEQVAMRDNWSEYSRRLALHWTLVTLAACCGVLLLYRLARKCWRGSVSVSRGA